MLKLQAYEAAAKADLAATQVVHVPLEEYAPGSERYERLMVQLEQANHWRSPEELRFNF
jgi:hypothetical protein